MGTIHIVDKCLGFSMTDGVVACFDFKAGTDQSWEGFGKRGF